MKTGMYWVAIFGLIANLSVASEKSRSTLIPLEKMVDALKLLSSIEDEAETDTFSIRFDPTSQDYFLIGEGDFFASAKFTLPKEIRFSQSGEWYAGALVPLSLFGRKFTFIVIPSYSRPAENDSWRHGEPVVSYSSSLASGDFSDLNEIRPYYGSVGGMKTYSSRVIGLEVDVNKLEWSKHYSDLFRDYVLSAVSAKIENLRELEEIIIRLGREELALLDEKVAKQEAKNPLYEAIHGSADESEEAIFDPSGRDERENEFELARRTAIRFDTELNDWLESWIMARLVQLYGYGKGETEIEKEQYDAYQKPLSAKERAELKSRLQNDRQFQQLSTIKKEIEKILGVE